LREQIDDLSTRLLMGELGEAASRGGGPLVALAQIGRQAQDAGYEEAARAAAQLLAELREGASRESAQRIFSARD
jgi:hypothetical protein